MLAFLTSAILLSTSLSLILAPSAGSYAGTMAQDDATAKQLAEEALDAAQTDILTQQVAGTTISTSYRYPSSGTNTISVPTYPGSGSTVAKGTYYVTAVYVRGFTILLKANVNVGSNNVAVSRLVQLNGVPDIMNNTVAIFSLRKAKSSYAGYAARVRCASNPSGATTVDVGFTASGDFDVAGLKTCLGDSTLPIDVVAGGKLAYGVRKLSSSYNGYALKVRRSSDSTTQDIGFDTNGNLDTVSLKTFVGSGSGYVATWYDQSGSGKDLTQATTTKQPRIVNAGVIDLKNGVPSLYFDGVDDSMSNTALAGTLITGSELRAFIVSSTESGGSNPSWGEFAVLWKSGDSDAYSTTTSIELLSLVGSSAKTGTQLNGGSAAGNGLSTGVLYQHTAYHAASNSLLLYRNGTQIGSDSVASAFAPTSVVLGTSAGSDASTNGRGYLGEFIVFNANLSTANRTAIERSQGHYYNVAGLTDGFVTTWYDQSGNGRDATQATTVNQPLLSQVALVAPTTAKLSSGVTFDGTNDYLATAATTAWPSAAGTRTLNVIYQLNVVPSSGNGVTALFWGAGSNGNASSINLWNGAGSGDGFVGWTSTYNLYASNTLDTSVAHRVTTTYDGANAAVYVNGTVSASGALTLNTTSNTVLYLGRDAVSSYPYGSIVEALVYNTALTSTQVSTLNTAQTTAFGN